MITTRIFKQRLVVHQLLPCLSQNGTVMDGLHVVDGTLAESCFLGNILLQVWFPFSRKPLSLVWFSRPSSLDPVFLLSLSNFIRVLLLISPPSIPNRIIRLLKKKKKTQLKISKRKITPFEFLFLSCQISWCLHSRNIVGSNFAAELGNSEATQLVK